MVVARSAGRPGAYRRYVPAAKKVVQRMSSKQVEVALASKIKKLERTVRARQPEEKFVDISMSFINVVDTVGAVNHLTQVAAGSDFNQRTGDSIRIHRIAGHFRVATGSGSLGAKPTGEEFISASIVVDGQQVGDTSPAASTVFADVTPPSVLLNEAISHRRFKILGTSPLFEAARIAPLSVPVAADSNQAPTQSPVWYYDLPCNLRVAFNGTATSDIEKNGIYMICRSSLTADTVDADGRCRLYYTDC